ATSSGRNCTMADRLATTRTWPFTPAYSRDSSAPMASTSPMIRRAWRNTVWPAGVMATPRVCRVINGSPTSDSMSAMRRLTAECAMNSRSAARAMLFSWQTVTNRRSVVKSSLRRMFSMAGPCRRPVAGHRTTGRRAGRMPRRAARAASGRQAGRRLAAIAPQQRGPARLRPVDAAFLYMPVAAYGVGQRRQLARHVAVVRAQRAGELRRQLQVVLHQPAFQAPLGGLSEQVEPGAPQALERRERAERILDPWPERALARLALGVAPRQQRRRQIVGQAVVAARFALELLAQGVLERGVGMQARDFVLVLVAHQPGQVAGHRQRDLQPARAGQLRLARAHRLDGGAVARRMGLVLVGAQVGRQAPHQRGER